ncbi:hypothetical protein [Haloferula sargassicola]|uniref:Uncharacterized protein n=1 Tax=Haloferula sargassicola TaxID=490096 RepID=A0ABP9UWI2_9BACT
MKSFEDAFSEQRTALDHAMEAGLSLQQFRSRHAERQWTREIGAELQVLLDEMTRAADELSHATRVVALRHREKLGGQ